jgi:hypothetical protein
MAQDALKIIRTLTADHNSAEIDLKNDHVWELNEHGDPSAIAIRTSYGLRSSGMRIFPQFTFQGITQTDPLAFAEPVRIVERRGNYLQLEGSPFTQLSIQLEYWVPASQVLAGRFKLTNSSDSAMNLSVDWAAILNPLENGEPMSAAQIGVNIILRGKSADVFPVFFITGGPEASPGAYPALQVRMTLAAGAARRLSWALASLDSEEASFSLARQSTSLQWDVEGIKSKMQARDSIVEFPGQDSKLADLLRESQLKAKQLLTLTPPPGKQLTFLTKRQPDSKSFSPSSRKEELFSFSQINTYDAWMISRILLPGDPHAVKEIIQSFIDYQQPDGAIPWAISKTGNPSTAMTPPLLAGIACDVNNFLEDNGWLAEIYPSLLKAFQVWFSRNPGSIPTWDDQAQCGLPNNPIYSYKDTTGLGNLPGMIESPALDALLIRECESLRKIAGWLGNPEHAEWLSKTIEELAIALDSCWDEKKSNFCYRDLCTGHAQAAENLHDFNRNGVFKLKRNFIHPRHFTISTAAESAVGATVTIKITGKNGEHDASEELDIRPGMLARQVISSRHFTRLETVEVTGLKPKAIVSLGLSGNDSEDISLLLPLLSGSVDERKKQAIIENTLIPRYLTKNGLTTFPCDQINQPENSILPFWNNLIIEGLLQANRRDLAGKVLSNLFDAQAKQWLKSGYVSSAFEVENLQSSGELDTLAGLPAIWPLLRAAGLEKITDREIILKGLNEFFRPITVQYKRAIVKMQPDLTSIQTVNGKLFESRERTPCRIFLP